MKLTATKLNPEDYYSVPELCALARVKSGTVWAWSRQRLFTTYKIGKTLLFKADEVNEKFGISEKKSMERIKQAA